MDLRYLIPRQHLGLFISSDFVEVAVARRDLKNLRIKAIYRRQISTQDVDIKDQNEIIRSAIEDLFTEFKLPKSHVILNLPTHDVILRTFKMPRLPSEEWDSAIRFEGQKHVPFRLNEMIFDYCVLDQDLETPEMNILFVCTRSSAVTRYTSILNSIGINCKGLNSVFISMVKACAFSEQLIQDSPTLIISVKKKVFGRERIRCVADMVVSWQGAPVVARDISVLGTQNDIDDKFFNELYLSVKLFNGALGERQIERILIVQGAELYKWDQFFGENFSATVHHLDLGQMLALDQTDGIALGASIADLVLPQININLLGGANTLIQEQFSQPPFQMKTVAVVSALLSLLIIALSAVWYWPQLRKVDAEIEQLLSAAGQYSGISMSDLKQKQALISETLSFLRPYRNKLMRVSDTIHAIEQNFPEKMWLTELVFTAVHNRQSKAKNNLEYKFNVKGIAFTENRVDDVLLINSLKKNIDSIPVVKKKMKQSSTEQVLAQVENHLNKEYTSFHFQWVDQKSRSKR